MVAVLMTCLHMLACMVAWNVVHGCTHATAILSGTLPAALRHKPCRLARVDHRVTNYVQGQRGAACPSSTGCRECRQDACRARQAAGRGGEGAAGCQAKGTSKQGTSRQQCGRGWGRATHGRALQHWRSTTKVQVGGCDMLAAHAMSARLQHTCTSVIVQRHVPWMNRCSSTHSLAACTESLHGVPWLPVLLLLWRLERCSFDHAFPQVCDGGSIWAAG